MKKNPEKHVCAWGPLPSQITVHVFHSKGKGKDNSDMLSGRWSTLLTLPKEDMTVVAGYHGGPCVCMCESLMKVKPPVQIYHHLQKYF